ncbi:182 kDa tankyrase-1-binding protein isoform X4 [Eublepharis macularius]|uniref:182 kDa tankyrase-1-binding protein isoform X4 n=1 Tax=Eublepharis macularius TaxID=481883 RepID=A0AA97IYZ1_EUBMA|nr:182 kDa tankyrase-1-binding protein isoform X4 [Eublepharis macularius]
MHRARLGRASIGPWISESEFQPGDVMDSKPQSLCSPVPCAATNGRSGAKQLSSSPDTGDARPKPPVKPKPCVLPKPAVPMKPTPVLRQALSEVPSAEKINLLAGPKPYSSGAGNSVKRLSFSLKCPPKEATNGKEVSPPFSFAIKPSADGEGAGSAKQSSVIEGTSGEEYRESSSVRKYSFPFKVKPVPVAAKPERFPGTTVEEILAKIEKPNKEGPESPDRPRLVRSFFSQEGGTAVHLGPKGYTAFRRYSSGGEGGEIQLEAPVYRASHEESRLSRNEEEATSSNDQHVPGSGQPATATERDLSFHSRDSSSSPPSMSCDGGQPGLRSPPSPPGVSVPQASQPLAKLSSGVTPGSPQAPAEPAQPPDELLASPPPSADDTKRRSMPKSDDPIGPEDLLGWSRKDLCSEFGIGETGQTSTFSMGWAEDAVSSKEEWPDETEQDREFGTGKRDWLSSYSAGDTDRQDVKFATSPQDWSGGTPLLGNSSTGQEDWLTAYGSSCADPQIRESDWSSRYSIDSAECQNTEPYVRKPGWPRLCTAAAADQESREFAMGNTDWNSQYTVSTADRTDWPSTAEPASCLESETNTKSLDVSDKCSPASHQDTQLSIGHSDIDVPYQEAAFSAQQAAWHGETNFDGSANELQIGFSAQQLEQPSECSANHPASQVNIQQHPRPDAYGFSDASCQESELSAKQSDWPTRFDLGVAQCQNSKFSVGKPDSIDVYDDSQTDWERKVGIVSRGSTPGFESGDAQFRAQKTVWPDAYILGETDPQSSNFLAGSRDWAKGTNVSGTEQKNQCSPARNNQGGSFDPLDMSDLRMTIDLVEISDSLIDQTEDLRTVAVDEPRGVGEGQSDWAQDLCLRDVSLSGVFTSENTDEPRKPTEKQLDWSSALGLARLSASSDAGLVNPELSREPGVGQADVPYGSGIGSMDVCDARSKGLDGAEEAGPVEMDWTSENQREHQDQSFCLGTTALSGGEMQHPGTSKDPRDSPSRESHSERLSSPSHLLEAMVANKAVEEVAQQKRPTSSHSCYSADEKALSSFPDEQVTATEKTRASLVSVEVKDDEKFWSNGDSGISQLDSSNCSQPPLEARQLSHLEQNGSQPARPISQEGHVTDGAEASLGETFLFLMDTEVLDSTAYRDRANLGRKRGHRAPATRSGGALSESDRDSWMFKDSTEPQVAPAVSDEEAPEEPKSRRPRNSPLSKGVKVPLFPVLNPSALKAKLRGRNRSAEEGDSQSEAKQSPAKEAHVQRSKSCKIASGKPLVLPPKPEKISGSETSSPNWLQVLKLKKKKS